MKWRLLVAFVGLLTVVLLAQDVPLVSYLRSVERDRLSASLERDAFILAGASENVLAGEESTDTTAGLDKTVQLYSTRQDARVVITDAVGRVVVASDPSDRPGDDFSNRPEIAQALTGAPATGQRDSVTAGEALLYVAVPVLSGAQIVGSVRITHPAAEVATEANSKTKGLIAVFLISLAAAVLAALLIANDITSPLRRLRRSTERLADGDFSTRAATDEGPPEVRSLARSFNSMTEQISMLIDGQRAFVGDASHQLRTPLTALRLQLERAAALIDADPVAARERLEAAGAETERLQRLVEGLLMIARADGSPPETELVDIGALAGDRAEVWSPLAQERGINVSVDVAQNLVVRGVRTSLEQIIDNLIDNALNASPIGGHIAVVATRVDGEAAVQILDEGPGMTPEHLARAFDRFWRAPDSPHGGSGIGLAVVDHLARQGGGRVELHNRDDRSGLSASVAFPVDERSAT